MTKLERAGSILACIERHDARWHRHLCCLPERWPEEYEKCKEWFEDRGEYLRSEYRASLGGREFKLPSR